MNRFLKKAVLALALLVAASDPVQKEVLIRLIVNLLGESVPASGAGAHD